MYHQDNTGGSMMSSSRSSFPDNRPSYGSQQRYGYGGGPSPYGRDQYNSRQGGSLQGGRGYGGQGGGGGRYQQQGGGYGHHGRDGDRGAYRQGNQGRSYGVSYGRGGGGRGGGYHHKPDHDHYMPRDQSRGRKDSGDDGFYGLRDYSNSSQDAIVPSSAPINHGPKYPPSSPRGRGGPRGRGRGVGRGAPRGQPRGSPRGGGRGRGRGGGRGRGRGRGRFRPRFVPNYDDKDFGCAFTLKNLPSSEFAYKDLRKLLKDKGLERNLTIVSLEEGVAIVKAMESFADVQEKLANLVMEDNAIDIEEKDLATLPKPEPKSPKGKFSPRGKSPSDKDIKVKMVFSNITNLPDQDMISASLAKVGLDSPKNIEERADSNTILFKLSNSNLVKDFKAKMRKIKVDKAEVTSVNVSKSKFKGTFALLKLHPISGYLKLDNIPEDYDVKKLKEKIKKKLGYQIAIRALENGKADVIYQPKVGTMLERLAGLTIGDKEILVSEVDEGEEEMNEEIENGCSKVQCPKALVGNKLANLLKNLEPNEIQFKSNSFLIRFNAKPKVLKVLKEKVENFDNTKVENKVVGKKGGKRTWSEEKEHEERSSSKGDESSDGKPVVPPVFSSMDIREKQKERKRMEEEADSVKMNPIGDNV